MLDTNLDDSELEFSVLHRSINDVCWSIEIYDDGKIYINSEDYPCCVAITVDELEQLVNLAKQFKYRGQMRVEK